MTSSDTTAGVHPALLTDRQRRVLFAVGALDLVWRGGELYDEFRDEPLDQAEVEDAHELERLGLVHVGDRKRAMPTEAGRALMHRIVPDRAPWWMIARAGVRQLLGGARWQSTQASCGRDRPGRASSQPPAPGR